MTAKLLNLSQTINYAAFPSVVSHFRCTEKSGLTITDSASGLQIDATNPALAATLTNPSLHAIRVKKNADVVVPTSIPWPSIPVSKHILMFMACRPLVVGFTPDGLRSGGSNSMGGAITMGTRLGLHSYCADSLDNTISLTDSGGVDESKTTTPGQATLLLLHYRPGAGQVDLIARSRYGIVMWQASYPNVQGLLTGSFQQQQSVGMTYDPTYSADSGYWSQADVLQKIWYVFDSEPPNIEGAITWHATKPFAGIKEPYPDWENLT
jgi:hypothetical protein